MHSYFARAACCSLLFPLKGAIQVGLQKVSGRENLSPPSNGENITSASASLAGQLLEMSPERTQDVLCCSHSIPQAVSRALLS